MNKTPPKEYKLVYTTTPSCVVRFILVGDELQPTEVTRLLGVEPHRSWAKGDEIPPPDAPSNFKPRRKRPTGYWSIVPNSSVYDDLDSQLLQLLGVLEKLPEEAHELIARYNGEISIGYSSGENNIGFFFGKEVVRRIFNLGLSINIDIYPVQEGQ